MRTLKILSLSAVLAAAHVMALDMISAAAADLASHKDPSVINGDATPHQACGQQQSPTVIAAKIRLVLEKYPHGGFLLATAIRTLLQNDPAAIEEVIYAATNEANPQQALAIDQGVKRAVILMRQSDPPCAQIIQAYLDANKANPVVAQILMAQASPDSVGSSNDNDLGGAGGGFVSGGGGQVSPH